jgi:uncharacterized flavoprotein (TIGR03862 family)
MPCLSRDSPAFEMNPMSRHRSIAIIGAGPSGLMAAEILSGAGHRVTIYDRMPSPARKFLIAGRGGLNLTHSEPFDTLITRYGKAASWLAPSIHAFRPQDLRQWCEGLGVETFVGSSGRVFPRSMKAVQLLRAWLMRLEQRGVRYAPRHRWLGWQGEVLCFEGPSQTLIPVHADATLLALGGASWPRLGSDGAWTTILSTEGISLAPLRPANCGFTTLWTPYLRERFQGQPLKPVTITHEGIAHQGEAMLTAEGIEGGVIYAHSAALREAIARDGSTIIYLDLRPTMPHTALVQKLHNRGNKSLPSFLRSAGFSPLIIALLHELTPPALLKTATAETLAAKLKALPVLLTGTSGMARAISSAGGVVQHEVTDDFMLRKKEGVFVAGEMLDWEAPTGGYLLQACFSTASVAAAGILDFLRKD